MTMPGFVPAKQATPIDRIAKIEKSLRAMQKAPAVNVPGLDYSQYGDIVSSFPRQFASPTTVGATSTGGQLFSTFLEHVDTDVSVAKIVNYFSLSNGATASFGVYAGPSLSTLALLGSSTPTLVDGAVTVATLASPVLVPAGSILTIGMLLTTGATAPSIGAYSPSLGLTNGLTGSGFATTKYNTSGAILFQNIDLTTGWTASSQYTLWSAVQ